MTDVSNHKAGKNQRCFISVLKVAQTRVTRDFEAYHIYIYIYIYKRLEQLNSAT